MKINDLCLRHCKEVDNSVIWFGYGVSNKANREQIQKTSSC